MRWSAAKYQKKLEKNSEYLYEKKSLPYMKDELLKFKKKSLPETIIICNISDIQHLKWIIPVNLWDILTQLCEYIKLAKLHNFCKFGKYELKIEAMRYNWVFSKRAL